MLNLLTTIYFVGVLVYFLMSVGYSQVNNFCFCKCNLDWNDVFDSGRLECFVWPFIVLGLSVMGLAQLIRLLVVGPILRLFHRIKPPVTTNKENNT